MRKPGSDGTTAKRRKSRQRFDVVGGLHGVVQVFAEQRQAYAADEAHQKREQDIARFLRARRTGRGQRGIHHANVAGTQSRGDARFFQLLQQPIVELLIRFRIVLQNVILNELFGEIVGLGLLLVQRFLQQFHVAARRGEFLFDAFHHGLSRVREILLDFLLLRRQAQDFRIIRAVLVEGFGVCSSSSDLRFSSVGNHVVVAGRG